MGIGIPIYGRETAKANARRAPDRTGHWHCSKSTRRLATRDCLSVDLRAHRRARPSPRTDLRRNSDTPRPSSRPSGEPDRGPTPHTGDTRRAPAHPHQQPHADDRRHTSKIAHGNPQSQAQYGPFRALGCATLTATQKSDPPARRAPGANAHTAHRTNIARPPTFTLRSMPCAAAFGDEHEHKIPRMTHITGHIACSCTSTQRTHIHHAIAEPDRGATRCTPATSFGHTT